MECPAANAGIANTEAKATNSRKRLIIRFIVHLDSKLPTKYIHYKMGARSVFTATAVSMTNVRPHGLAVRTETGERFGTPIGRRIIGIVEFFFAWIRDFTGVHAFVADIQAMHGEIDLR